MVQFIRAIAFLAGIAFLIFTRMAHLVLESSGSAWFAAMCHSREFLQGLIVSSSVVPPWILVSVVGSLSSRLVLRLRSRNCLLVLRCIFLDGLLHGVFVLSLVFRIA